VQVAAGIHKVDGTRVGNAYIVEGAEGILLVDTGMPGTAGRVIAALEALGHRPADVRAIVLTHWHMDHVGNAARLRRLTGAPVAIHGLDAPILAGGPRPEKGRRTMGLLIRLFRMDLVEADVTLRDGDVIGGLRVIHVPGHTDGSIALRGEGGVLFTGDALLGDRHGRVKPPDAGLSLDPAQASRSADSLLALKPSLILPGHGAPVRA
jgi:glyoxylase-like metal-dependent hydrolase (beta-lactamase superfamily II)